MKALGKVFKYGDNVDTDVIIPARYLNSSDPAELATHCMEDIDKDFVNQVKKGDIIVAEKNFGCGSSREHAPIAIKASGVSCVIAKLERYRGNERADKRVEEILKQHQKEIASGKKPADEKQILVLSDYVPCQKYLSETDIAFVIFPSNRGGYCIQPQKREYSLNYKCSFPESWLGLEKEELKEESGLSGAEFCHKGGFLMTTSTLEDAIKACKISQQQFHEQVVIVNLGTDEAADALLFKLPQFSGARIVHMELPDLPPMEWDGIYGESTLEKQEWKAQIKDQVKKILKSKPEAVYVQGDLFAVYPLIHALRKRHMPVLVMTEMEGEQKIVRIPSGS